MKYKRLLLFVTSMIFFTALVVCFFTVFKIAEISVTATEIEGSNENIEEKVIELCNEKYGENLLFTSIDTINEDISKTSGYVKVISIKKNYPNKLEIVIEERVENFAVFYQDSYYMLDGDMYVVAKKRENANNVDGKKNMLLEFDIADIEEDSLTVGKTFKVADKVTNEYLSLLSDDLYLKRGDISSVNITVKKAKVYFRRLTLNMREGITINIDKAHIKSKEKLSTAYEFYLKSQNKADSIIYYVNELVESGEIIVGT